MYDDGGTAFDAAMASADIIGAGGSAKAAAEVATAVCSGVGGSKEENADVTAAVVCVLRCVWLGLSPRAFHGSCHLCELSATLRF